MIRERKKVVVAMSGGVDSSVTAGQAAVFYRGDPALGGGWIETEDFCEEKSCV